MKLGVGMYIKTDEGIRKILNEYEEGYELDRRLHYLYPEGHDLYKQDLKDDKNKIVIKASFNIIDLIGVGDYVNGHRVLFVNNNDVNHTITVETSDGAICELIARKGIKSILTKEQMEAIQYVIE